MDDHDEEKRTKHNLIVCSSKFEVEVTNNRRMHSRYCSIKANYRQNTKHRVASLWQQSYLFVWCPCSLLTSRHYDQFVYDNDDDGFRWNLATYQ